MAFLFVFRNKRNTSIIVVFLWVVSLLVFIPVFIITQSVTGFETYCIERLDRNSRIIYATLMFIFFYMVPQTFLGYCYTAIALKLWNHKKSDKRMSQVAKVTLKIKCKLVKLTFAVALAFAICWLPMHIAAIMNAVGVAATDFSYHFQLFAPCFAYFTVSLNPIIYCFMSKTFRKCLKATFTCGKLRFFRPFIGVEIEAVNQQDSAAQDSGSLNTKDVSTTAVSQTPRHQNGIEMETFMDKQCQTERRL